MGSVPGAVESMRSRSSGNLAEESVHLNGATRWKENSRKQSQGLMRHIEKFQKQLSKGRIPEWPQINKMLQRSNHIC